MCEIVCRTKTIIYYTLENDKRIIYYFVTSSVFYYVYTVYIVHTKRSKSALSHQPPTLLRVGKSRSPRPRVTFSSDPFRSTTACNELFLDHYTDIIIIIIIIIITTRESYFLYLPRDGVHGKKRNTLVASVGIYF